MTRSTGKPVGTPENRPLSDGPHHRRAAFVLAGAATALALLGDMFVYAVLPVQFTDLGLGKKQVGLLLSVNRLVRLVTNRLAGAVCDVVGVSLPFIAATFVGALVCASYGVIRGFVLLLIARMVWGLCWSFIRLGYLQTTVRNAPDHRLGAAMGLVGGISRSGALVGVLGGGYLGGALGFRSAALCLSVVSVLAIIPAWLSQRPRFDRGRRRRAEQGAEGSPGEALAATGGGLVEGLGAYLSRIEWPRPLTLLGANFAVGMVGGGIVFSTLGRLLEERFPEGVPLLGRTVNLSFATGMVLAARWMVDTALAPAVGWLADRVGRRRMIGAAFGAGGFVLMVLPLARGFAPIVGAALAFFFCSTMAGITLSAEASLAVPPHKRNRYLSWFVTASDLGSTCGPLLAWFAIDGFRTPLGDIPPAPLATVYHIGGAIHFAALALLAGRHLSARRSVPESDNG